MPMQVPLMGVETSHRPGYFDADFSGEREHILMIKEWSRRQGPSGQKLHCLVVIDAAAA